jgi:hypothetical protein
MNSCAIAKCGCIWALFLAWTSLAPAAEEPSFTIAEISIVSEVRAGEFRRQRRFGYLLMEVRGHVKLPEAPVELDFNPRLVPQPAVVEVDDPFDVGFLGIGVIDERKGEAIYPYLNGMPAEGEKPVFSAKLASGAGIEIQGIGGSQRVRFLTADTPIAMAFRQPAPRQPEFETGVDVYMGNKQLHAAGPVLSISTKDLGWPVPAAKQKEADRTFAAGLPFFLWTEKPLVNAGENYLRYAINPKLALDAVPEKKDLASKMEMAVTHKVAGGATTVPFTSIANENFGIYHWSDDYQGRGKATLIILERSNDPQNAEKAPALSNRLNFQVSFDPIQPAKGRKARAKRN